MPQYMLILHDVPADYARLGRLELSQLVQKYVDWEEDLRRAGHLVASFKLAGEIGRRISVDGGRPVPSDGPYAEAKDVIGGEFIVEAASLADAESIARTSPHLRGRNSIEIRRVDEDSCDAAVAEASRSSAAVGA